MNDSERVKKIYAEATDLLFDLEVKQTIDRGEFDARIIKCISGLDAIGGNEADLAILCIEEF